MSYSGNIIQLLVFPSDGYACYTRAIVGVALDDGATVGVYPANDSLKTPGVSFSKDIVPHSLYYAVSHIFAAVYAEDETGDEVLVAFVNCNKGLTHIVLQKPSLFGNKRYKNFYKTVKEYLPRVYNYVSKWHQEFGSRPNNRVLSDGGIAHCERP